MIDTIVNFFKTISDSIEQAIQAREMTLDDYINSHHPSSISEVEYLEDQYLKRNAGWR